MLFLTQTVRLLLSGIVSKDRIIFQAVLSEILRIKSYLDVYTKWVVHLGAD